MQIKYTGDGPSLLMTDMYLAKIKNGSETSFQIRQSYRTETNSFYYRVIYELGNDPRRWIDQYEDHVVIFNDNLVDTISTHTADDSESILEQLLWDFLPDETKRRLSMFNARGKYQTGPLTDDDRKNIASQIHLFDLKRLYYLRYGAVDQSRLSRLHEKCCRPLLGQSRDEREYYFAAEESALNPGNYLEYVYAVFNLQKYFTQSFAPWLPESLAIDEMEEHFEKELCILNKDHRFWQDEETPESLHHHLIRYLIMFFDYTPVQRSFSEAFAKTFMGNRRSFRWPEKTRSHPPEKVSKVFTTSYDELKKMTREQLNRLYRKKAMQLHPDGGGDHDLFIELTEIYNDLLNTKK